MEITTSRVSLSLAVLIAIVCCAEEQGYMAFPRMGRSTYLAFPRMGRSGYLAFPRMGRSGAKAVSGVECCGVGLKEEFLLGQDGKEELRTVCAPTSECCGGLREVVDEKPDGTYYSMCIPDIPGHPGSRAQVLNKLKNMLRK